MYAPFRSFLNKLKKIITTAYLTFFNFISFYTFNILVLLLNIFCINQKIYSLLLKKLDKFTYFNNNLYIFRNKTFLEVFNDENYIFVWEDPKTILFFKNKKKYALWDLYIKFKKKKKKQNILFYYLFNKNSWKYYAFIKTIVYYELVIQNTWDHKQSFRDYVKNFNMILLPDVVEDYFFMHNYLNSWQSKHKINMNSLSYKFILKPHSMKFLYYFYFFFKNFMIPFFISILFLMYSFFFFKLAIIKTVASWIIFLLIFFWFFSTFNFFIKRYRFSKYTSAIQRFWKRAFMCFWLIEGFLFAIFFYYLLNASGEPTFMFDTYGIFVNHLLPIKQFLMNSFLIVFIIHFIIYLIINIKITSLRKNAMWLFFITLILLYMLFVESYQFYYILNFYIEYIWVFSEDDSVWELDYDIPRTRNKNHYITLIVVAKFWHYIFIFVSWIFFLMKTLELKRIRYTFLSMNLQNFILFYIMNWLCLYSWFKWIFRRFMDQTYYWFFTSFRPLTVTFIFNDLFNLFKNMFFVNNINFKNKFSFNFYYFLNTSTTYTQSSFFKKKILLSFFA